MGDTMIVAFSSWAIWYLKSSKHGDCNDKNTEDNGQHPYNRNFMKDADVLFEDEYQAQQNVANYC